MNTAYFEKKNYKPKLKELPSKDLGICVVIPSYKEENLNIALSALSKCILPKCNVEVLVVVNHPQDSPEGIVEISQETLQLVENFNRNNRNEKIEYFAVKAFDLPKKHAGVGLARQIGMDEAAFRLLKINSPLGIIACFDADSTCDTNYLTELEKLWEKNPKTNACSIRYAHPLSGSNYNPTIYKGIAEYELHLRYYNQASRYIGFPFAYHTVGSSMACSTSAYVKFGGMNRHQAGEDFYFLQKIIPHGNFLELNSTCIIPSPRPSDRVPFGTGRAMSKHLDNNEPFTTYQLESFLELKTFFSLIEPFYNTTTVNDINTLISQLPQTIKTFLLQNNATNAILSVKKNSASLKAYRKRFFLWFDAFALLKYMNFSNENTYKRQPVIQEAEKLLTKMNLEIPKENDAFSLLKLYRSLDEKTYQFTF